MKASEKDKKSVKAHAAADKKKKEKRESRLLAKKPYLELVTAILSIPVLITVIILNFTNLKNINAPKTTPTPVEKIIYTSPKEGETATNTDCKKEIGPIDIISPEEGDKLKENPVSVVISYDDKTYCPVVWSYRTNGGDWSAYDDKSIALYNLPRGNVKLELRVKSLSSNDSQTLTRSFSYDGENSSDDNEASASGN